MIPKIIHYCWFGENPIPDNQQRYMATWRTLMPDWEIKEWNEHNFSIATAPVYVQEAYRKQKWAFVSDYVRLWALNQHGGVYLDTDVEVLKSFEDLLNNIAFIVLWYYFGKMVGNINGWEPFDIFGLYGFSATSFGLVCSFFYGVFNIPTYISTGNFDKYLLTPKNTLLKVSTSAISTSAIGDLVFGIICFIIFAVVSKLTFL